MTAGQRKPENQWTGDERKAANLDQRLKSLIMSVLPDDQMNSNINCLTAKSTWDDLILYHEDPSEVKESRVMDLKLCYNTFKFKEGESLTQTFTRYKALINKLVNDGIKLLKLEINTGFINGLPKKWDFQDSLGDEEDTKSSHEYLNDLKEEYQTRSLLAKSKRFFKKGIQRFTSAKATDQIKCHKCCKKGHFARDCRRSVIICNEMVEVKVLMALVEENDAFSKEGARNGEWVKISMRKVHTLLEMKDNDDRKVCLEQLLVLKQVKLDFLTMKHVNTKILKENKNLRTKLKELKEITETCLNSSNKVNQCISEQIPSQKKIILEVDQLIEDPSSSGLKDPIFVKSSTDDTKVTIPSVERPWLSEAEGFILPNHDTGRILPFESQRNTTNSSVAVTDSSVIDYDSTNESSVCSIPLPPLKKLNGVEPISRPNTIKSILRSKSTFKAEALKDVTINEPSSAPAKGNKSSSALKVHSAPVGKLKSVKIGDDPPLAIRLKNLGRMSSRPNIPRPSKRFFPPFIHCGGPKVVFGDDSTCTTEGYGSIKCNGIVFTKFNEKRGTIFNSNKEIVMIAPRGKHHKDAFKTKQTSSIKKCLHLLHMVLFGHVTTRSINHEKYTLVIVNEYSRYTWVYFLNKKTQAPETIMSFIKRVENQNDIKVKQLKTDNGTEFRNSTLVNFCDEKGISQNFSSPYTLEQNGIAEKKNRTLIKAARTMLSGSDFSKQYWTEVRIPNISFLHVFRCQVYIHNHKDHLRKFDEKADDGYLLGYSLVSKAFRVFNTRIQQTEETYHIAFDEIPEAIKFSKPLVDNINIAESERYPHDEYLHPYEPSQRNKVWTLVPVPYGKTIIGSRRVFRNKSDKTVIVIKKQARLVAQGYNQQEGIDYDETFALVARLEAIRIFLAFSTYMNYKVYQMAVKSVFLNGKLKEEVYVKQPPGFESNEFPNRVCKLDKALMDLTKLYKHGFDLKGYSDSDYAGCNMDRKSTLAEAEYVAAVGCCANILWMKS
nr:retrovirus-related Pol polyprotein from transposon TNT 1-94 [Tanacetum cinerariifolium]